MIASAGFGRPKSKREPVEVIEPKPMDKSLDKLLGVRKSRLDRMERERKDSQERWRGARRRFREAKDGWRASVQATKDFWAQARKEFMSMQTTSGQYQRAKGAYERMKEESASLRVTCLEMLEKCRTTRSAFFEARERVLTANRQQEKLTIMRDEMRELYMKQNEA